jgi:hypothetical protein
VLDVVAQEAACAGHADLLRELVGRGARPAVFGAGALWCLYQSRFLVTTEVPPPARHDLAPLADVVHQLVRGGADVKARFTNGESILEAAVVTCEPALVEPLLAGNVDPNVGHRQPPLVAAARCRQDLLSLLLARGANVEARDFYRATAAEALCTAELDAPTFRARLETLMTRSARPRVLDGRTLTYAAGRGNLASITELLIAGANPNGRDEWGNTPLHGLAEHCHDDCESKAKALLGAGADPGARSSRGGATPYDVAVANRHAPLVGHLLASWDWRPLGSLGAKATASGVLVEKGRREDFYSPARAIDGATGTCWCVRYPDLPTTEQAHEMFAGDLSGPTITVRFARPARIRAIRIYSGCGDSPATYQANNRITGLQVRLGEYPEYWLELPDAMRFFDLGVSPAKPSDQVEIRVHSIARGSRYDDTCIAEIQAVLE